MPIQKARATSGRRTPYSRRLRSGRDLFTSCVTGPNIVRWYIQSRLAAPKKMPLLNGIIGECTIPQCTFLVSKSSGACASLGIVRGAAYLLWLYQRTMFGPVTHEVNKSLPDLNLREYGVLLPLVALAFWIGIYPKPFFGYIEKPVQRIVQQVNPGFYQGNRTLPPATPVATPASEVK